MPILEVDPFIEQDIRQILKEKVLSSSSRTLDINEIASKIIEKVAEFVNENYIPKK